LDGHRGRLMATVRDWFMNQSKATRITAGVVLVAVLVAAFVVVARATDQPSFCRSCHEMTPYHDAWSAGPHNEVSCIECHVDEGEVPRLLHKFVALREVVSHVRGDTSFPRDTFASVPDYRCKRCHEQVTSEDAFFDHGLHEERGPCMKCHAFVGHDVSIASLKAAGIYSGAKPSYPASKESSIAVVDDGRADLPGHVSVYCSTCHRMSNTTCSACHKPPHQARGECTTCHRPGTTFVFTHPKNRPDCQTCHTKSATHTTIKGACSDCHKQPGVAWSFVHPPKSATCTECHVRPANHRGGPCSTCHAAGANWAFDHPGRTATCANCHARPAQHASGECSRCHGQAGVSWAFRHPGAGANCTGCHRRPPGHSSRACSTCHAVGTSWRFRHPSSSGCSPCHRAPRNHYGSSCASCHTPSRAWSSATFRHARIPGGEHSYRSFACSNCHPNGYSTHTCARCHDSASGPRDD